MKHFLLTLLLFSQLSIYSQKNEIDSLNNIIHNEQSDSLRFLIALELSRQFVQVNIDSSWHYNVLAGDIQKQINSNHPSYYFLLEFNKCHLWVMNNEFKEAESALLNLIEWLNHHPYTLYEAQTHAQLGIVYQQTGLLEKAKKHLLIALKHSEEFSLSNLCRTQQRIGAVYHGLGIIDSCFYYYKESLNTAYRSKNIQDIGNSHSNLAIIYDATDSLALSIEHFKKSVEIFDDTQLEADKLKSRINLGTAYLSINELDKSAKLLSEAVTQGKKSNNYRSTALALINLADVYSKKDEITYSIELLEEALELIKGKILYYEAHILNERNRLKLENNFIEPNNSKEFSEAIQACKKTGYLSLIGYSYLAIGDYYLKTNLLELSKVYLDSALNSFDKIGETEGYLDVYTKIIELHITQGKNLNFDKIDQLTTQAISLKKYKRASNLLRTCLPHLKNDQLAEGLYQKLILASDSLNIEEQNKTLQNLQIKYETEKKDHQIEFQNQRLSLQESKLLQERQLRNFAIMSSLFLLLLVSVVILLYKKTIKLKNIEQNFNTELTHRLANYFKSIRSFIALNQEINSTPAGQLIDRVIGNMRRTESFIDLKNNPKRMVDVSALINDCVEGVVSLYPNKNVDVQIEQDKVLLNGKAALAICNIIEELVRNSFKYAFPMDHDNPEIKVTLKKENDSIHLQVSDNGTGYDFMTKPKGSGLGRTLIYNSLEELGGTEPSVSVVNGTNWSATFEYSKFLQS